MKKTLLLALILYSVLTFAQDKYTLSGIVVNFYDKQETLISANIMYTDSKGVVSDMDGKYTISLVPGTYNLVFSYVGFKKKEVSIQIVDKNVVYDAALEPMAMEEVRVVADIARTRETPVAFSSITPEKLKENLGSQDIPLILNSTPGVYATQQGGGDGDAEVSIRGFSARNVGVLLDGVPVNDMETGRVYWSNWFGLDAVTRSIQVQRGLGASKLALPSVGGTINILTSGIESKREGMVKQEVGSDGYLRSSFGYSSGMLKNDWGFSLAGSYKRGNGWVDRTFSEGYFYYFKIDKKLGGHTMSLSGYGAPQRHEQRAYQLPVAVYDSAYAEKVGVHLAYTEGMTEEQRKEVDENRINADEGINRGLRFNQHWGYLARTKENPNATSEPFSERVNHYHKPQFTLKDFWRINDNLFFSNIAYMSIGNGGGIRSKGTIMPNEDGLMDFQSVYDRNIGEYTIAPFYNDSLHAATNYMRNLVNQHMWYGLVSTLDYTKDEWNFSGGLDLRNYKGTHYEEIYDLLGADYVASTPANLDGIDWTQPNPYKDYMLFVGDKTNFHTDGLVQWGGAFFQTKYKTENLSTFLNLTGAVSRYKQINYFYGKNDKVVNYDTGWNTFPGFTVKTGANYNLNKHNNAFFNVGYLNKAPQFNDVYDYNSLLVSSIRNEKIKAAEIGYSYVSRPFTININTYYTDWQNRPADASSTVTIDGEPHSVKINTMNAIHKGVEMDFIYKINSKLAFQGLVSLGDWRWNSEDTFRIYSDEQILLKKQYYNNKNVHVGNSAQTQFGAELRWEPVKHFYIKPSATYFGRYYAEFDPITLNGTPESYEWYNEETGEHGDPRDSWQVPSYVLVDLHMGYSTKLGSNYMKIRMNILNLLNETYVSSAQNNDPYNGQKYNDFDAKSAAVYMGMGRRFSLSLEYDF